MNLAAATITDGVLIVAVEWFPDPRGRTVDAAGGGGVSVNWSGFTREELERLRFG